MTEGDKREAIAAELRRSQEAMQMAEFGIREALWSEGEGRLYSTTPSTTRPWRCC